MYRPILVMGSSLLLAVFVAPPTLAVQTRIDVRVLSKGAKFIGTSMGGAEITVEDADTGELLVRGKTSGSTGSTDKIMKQQATRHAPVSTEDAGVFRAMLDLREPRRIKVAARGPLAQRQAIGEVSATVWVVPGKHVTGGDGLTLEMPGFVVDVLSPPAHQKIELPVNAIDLRANVTMMCGCPIEPDGLWDANRVEVVAVVRRDGEEVCRVPLRYAGATSQFATSLELNTAGAYRVTVYAYESANGNTGVDETTFILQLAESRQ
jgi:hypothetical protein